jgi:hypothetical protein
MVISVEIGFIHQHCLRSSRFVVIVVRAVMICSLVFIRVNFVR